MARVNQRLWRAPGLRAKRKAWGFTVQVDGKQKRVYKAEWTKDEAQKALAALLLRPTAKRGGGTLDHPSGGTTTEAAQRQEHESPYEGRDSRLGLPRRRLASQVS